MKAHPYVGAEDRAFWSRTGAVRPAQKAVGFLRPKFKIDRHVHRIACAGSCFAQHIARALRYRGYQVIDAEPISPGVPLAASRLLGFGLYSARYGNIYTARHLLQLLREAYEDWRPDMPVWQEGGRFFDAMRPGVDPGGFGTAEDVGFARSAHLAAVRSVFDAADTVVFTLGLTEVWMSRRDGTVYPTAPGVIAGQHDPALFQFHNFTHSEVLADLEAILALLRSRRPEVRLLLTVSPVPLAATASGAHVEVATGYSKAVLRGAAGEMAARHAAVEYFPSYEIVTAQAAAGAFFDETRRSVTRAGVRTVIETFESVYGARTASEAASAETEFSSDDEELVCEELLVEGLAR